MRRLARDMLETMHAASGVGLAAPQVGVRQRVIVVDVGEAPIVVVNPEITAAEGEQVGLGGCLSLPDLVGEVRRAEWVVVKGLNCRGKPVAVESEGLLARALQHEVDHLDGILFIDCGGCGHERCYDMAREIVAGSGSVEDCVSLRPATEVKIDGRPMPMNPFISGIVRGTILGMLSSLKGFRKGKIEISI